MKMRQLNSSSTTNKSNQKLWLLSSFLGITISSTILLFLHRRRRRQQQHISSRDGDSDYDNDGDETIQALKPAFDKACEMIKNPKLTQSLSLSQNDQLMLYGLYKQVISGNAASASTPPPSKLQLVEYAKYDAWTKFHNMPRDFAMMKYVEVVDHFYHHARPMTGESTGGISFATERPGSTMTGASLLFDDNDDIVYDDDDDDDTDEFLSSSDDDNDDDNGDSNANDGQSSNENKKLKTVSVSKSKEEHSSLSSASTFSLSVRQSTLMSHSSEPSSHNDDYDSNLISYDNTRTGATTTMSMLTSTSAFTKATLLQASSTGNQDIIQKCIENGVDTNGRDENGQTALHLSADKGYIDCVNLLLSNGADPNAADETGISVLEVAVIGGDVDVVKALLEAGSDPDQEDMDGETPRSCAEDDACEEIQLLLRDAPEVQRHES